MFFSRVASISTAGATRPRRRGPPGCPRTGRCPRRSTPAAVEVGLVRAGQLVAAVLDPAAVEVGLVPAALDPGRRRGRPGARRRAGARGARPGRRRGTPGCPRTGRWPRSSTRPPSRSGWCAPASWCPRCSTPAAVEVGPVPAGQLVAAVLDPAAVEALQVMAAVLDPAAVEALQVPADGPVPAVLDRPRRRG